MLLCDARGSQSRTSPASITAATHSMQLTHRRLYMSEQPLPSRPPLVLIANDQEWSARSLESILGPAGYAVLRAYTGRQALDIARNAQPDAVILDYKMPDLDGIEVCRLLQNDSRFSRLTPIIVTTSSVTGRTQRLAAYDAGAWEFCSQPLDADALLFKLGTFVRAKHEADRAREESLLDQITGLYNMRGLARRAREIGAEAYRRSDPLACIAFAPEPSQAPLTESLVDQIAERIVGHLGEIVRKTGRVSDAIGRLGQSEFAIIAPATEAAGAVRLAERIRESVEESPLRVDGAELPMRIRAGYCAVPDFAKSPVDAVELLLRAAAALRYSGAESTGRIRAFEEVPLLQAN